MATSRITYNSKNIDLAIMPFEMSMVPARPRTSNTTLTGEFESICTPRTDIAVRLNFRIIQSLTLRLQLDKWWQWASTGNTWSFAIDSTKIVDTISESALAAGATVVTVSSSTGITAGQTYKMINGPTFELVTVSSVSNDLVTLSTGLDSAFGAGAIFRDRFYFPAIIRNDAAPLPIQDVPADEGQPWPPTRFTLSLELVEDTRKDEFMSGTYTPTLYNTTNIAASTAYQCQYMRVGNVVHVSGLADIDPTATTTPSTLGISLPVASNFGSDTDCAGIGSCNLSTPMVGSVIGDATNDRALLNFNTLGDAGNHGWSFMFTYEVI